MTSKLWILADRLTGYRFESLRVRAVAAFLEREPLPTLDFRDVLASGLAIDGAYGSAPEFHAGLIPIGNTAAAATNPLDGTSEPSASGPAENFIAAAGKSPRRRHKPHLALSGDSLFECEGQCEKGQPS